MNLEEAKKRLEELNRKARKLDEDIARDDDADEAGKNVLVLD